MKETPIVATITVALAAILYQTGTELFMPMWFATLAITAGALYALHYTHVISKSSIYAISAIFIIMTVAFTFYIKPAAMTAESTPPVLDDNWFQALNWIKNNTAQCSTIATYWDPGHFIRAIAERTVVFDGGSQNNLLGIRDGSNNESGNKLPLNLSENAEKSGLVTVHYDNGISRVMDYNNGVRETARIQDIAATMMTSNESLAAEILKDYVKPGCNETYFIASSDLIGKAVWWTYFATWSPEKKGTCTAAGVTNPKGDCYQYSILNLASATPNGQSIIYSYAAGANQAFIVNYDTVADKMRAYFSENNNLHQLGSVFYFTKDGSGAMANFDKAELGGMLWVEPGRNMALYIPSQLKDAMFTRLFFFNGVGLKNFEPVSQWGGELKLFRVKF